ncbi:hypothetical protein TSAR_008570 [Trichomalopsis sarcophagae]|uniref:Uncharacterized protein n=1 Tax=Trichomalopsis sarcophagae TaxID=543379 RepID=A0A232EG70_9HYME|nr:hypothetical protein TSAR_008570 [Trichomalopsis sarcophagae]
MEIVYCVLFHIFYVTLKINSTKLNQ